MRFDAVTDAVFHFLEKYFGIYLGSSQSRWGILSIAVAMLVALIAIALSLWAIYLSEIALAQSTTGGDQMADVIRNTLVILWVFVGLITVIFVIVVWLGVYWLRHQNRVSLEQSLINIDQRLGAIELDIAVLPSALAAAFKEQGISEDLALKIAERLKNQDSHS